MLHRLKTLPAHYTQAYRGLKKFEIRDNSDRGFQAGDMIILQEYFPKEDKLSGSEIIGEITYVSNYNQKKNIVVFAYTVTSADDPFKVEES